MTIKREVPFLSSYVVPAVCDQLHGNQIAAGGSAQRTLEAVSSDAKEKMFFLNSHFRLQSIVEFAS